MEEEFEVHSASLQMEYYCRKSEVLDTTNKQYGIATSFEFMSVSPTERFDTTSKLIHPGAEMGAGKPTPRIGDPSKFCPNIVVEPAKVCADADAGAGGGIMLRGGGGGGAEDSKMNVDDAEEGDSPARTASMQILDAVVVQAFANAASSSSSPK